MSESKFTPGPWTQDDSHGRRFIERVGTGDTVAIVCKVDGKDGYIAMNANSALIAAAPDLLEALIESRQVIATALKVGAPDWFDSDEKISQHVTVKKIDAAIQRATARPMGKE